MESFPAIDLDSFSPFCVDYCFYFFKPNIIGMVTVIAHLRDVKGSRLWPKIQQKESVTAWQKLTQSTTKYQLS